jgi:hypothetical protein
MHSNTISNSSFQPTNVSPEFAEWLACEKADAVRHQRRIIKASAMLALAIVLFVLKDNSEWLAGLLDLDAYAVN